MAKFCFSHFTLIRVKCKELFCKTNIKWLYYSTPSILHQYTLISLQTEYSFTVVLQIKNMVQQCSIANLKLLCMYCVLVFLNSYMYRYTRTRYTIHDVFVYHVPNSVCVRLNSAYFIHYITLSSTLACLNLEFLCYFRE